MNPLAAALTFAGRDFRVARSYRVAFVVTILSTLTALVTFRLIAAMIGDAPGLRAQGGLFGFWVIGMAMAQVLEGAISAPAGAVRGEQVQGTLEVLATTPLSPASLAAGWISFPLVQALLTGAIMIAFAGPMGLRFTHPSWFAASLAFALSAPAFAGIGIMGAALVLMIQQAAGLTKWVTAGMTLVSGVFYGIGVLPGWVRPLAEVSPLTHSLRALRAALLQGRGIGAIRGDLLALILTAAVLLPLAVGTLSVGLRRARRRGSLATY